MLRGDVVAERIRDQGLSPVECDIPDRWWGARAERRPVDTAGEVPGDSRHADPEPDREVGADRLVRNLADPAEQRGHAKRAQDEADETAQEADERAGDDGGADVEIVS